MDLHGSEISRVGSRREISRVCLQDRQNFVHLPTHKEFCSGALRAHVTHTHPSPERRTARLTRHSSAHASTSTARARSSAYGVALWGKRSEPHGKFCTAVQLKSVFRMFGPYFARLTRLRNFAVLTPFRAFASLAAKFRLLLTHERMRATRL